METAKERRPQPSGWRSELRAAKRKCFLHVFLKMRIRENKTLTEKEKKEVKKLYEALWNEVLRKVSGGSYDVLVMDEFMAAYRYGLIPNEEALCFLEKKPTGLEVVLTGRDPDLRLVEKADYVSEICKVKHPYDRGIRARRGIEY